MLAHFCVVIFSGPSLFFANQRLSTFSSFQSQHSAHQIRRVRPFSSPPTLRSAQFLTIVIPSPPFTYRHFRQPLSTFLISANSNSAAIFHGVIFRFSHFFPGNDTINGPFPSRLSLFTYSLNVFRAEISQISRRMARGRRANFWLVGYAMGKTVYSR